MTLITLLVYILIFGLLVYLVEMLPIAPPFKLAARVVMIVIAIIFLLRFVGGANLRL